MGHFNAGKLCMLVVLVSVVACSGTPRPDDPAALACNGAPADLVIQHREVAGGVGGTNREVNFRPGVPEVVLGTDDTAELCVAFDRANGRWRTAHLSNFETVWGPEVIVSARELSLTPDGPSDVLQIEATGSGISVVKYDLRFYRGKSATGTPALTVDPVFIIKP